MTVHLCRGTEGRSCSEGVDFSCALIVRNGLRGVVVCGAQRSGVRRRGFERGTQQEGVRSQESGQTACLLGSSLVRVVGRSSRSGVST